MKIQEEKIELQKKVHRKTCVTSITFLAECPASYVIFCSFFRLLPHFCLLRFYPASQYLWSRETKQGHRLTLAVSAFDFHKL